MILGYARVSTRDQNLERQTDQLLQSGCERIFQEKITGSKKERPELDKLLDQLRPDDIIVVSELTRLSRSIRDLFVLVDMIHQKGAHLKSMKEPWLDTTTSHGKLLFAIFAGVSQFERNLISERTRDGLSSVYKSHQYQRPRCHACN
jgi:DNA invertase Pin-like site-specific DNA recombinase